MVTAATSAAASASSSALASPRGIRSFASASPSLSPSPRPMTSDGLIKSPAAAGGGATLYSTPSGMARRPGTSGHSISSAGSASASRTFARTMVLSSADGGDPFPPAPGTAASSRSGASTPLATTAHTQSGTVTPVLVPLPLRGLGGGSGSLTSPTSATASSDVGASIGSDGRVYSGRGSRTHRLVATAARKSAAARATARATAAGGEDGSEELVHQLPLAGNVAGAGTATPLREEIKEAALPGTARRRQ
jgi:hypothetical protein